MQVFVRDNNVDQAMRALKKKMQREGLFRELKQRRAYEKPSERRVREKAEAIRRVRRPLASRLSATGCFQDRNRNSMRLGLVPVRVKLQSSRLAQPSRPTPVLRFGPPHSPQIGRVAPIAGGLLRGRPDGRVGEVPPMRA